MSFDRLSLLTFAAALWTAAATHAGDPTPRLSALEALGQQNMNSILSDPRTGGPQGVSISELPAARAYCQAKQVDAIWAVRAGSTAPIPQFDLAHPSHNPHAKGSRPFVSAGPISQTPGFNPRLTPRSLSEYRLLTQKPAPVAVPVTTLPTSHAATVQTSAPVATTTQTPIFSSSFQQWGDAPTAQNQL